MAQDVSPAADFQALPLEFILAQPLTAAIKAQMVAAQATKQFIESFIDQGKPMTIDLSATVQTGSDPAAAKTVSINAPLLAMVPIPHIQIDSLRVNFKYSVSQTMTDASVIDKGIEAQAASGKALSPWVSASVKGHLSSNSKQESVMNRSGVLEIEMQASEAPIPEGLARLLNLLADAISVNPANANPPDNAGGQG